MRRASKNYRWLLWWFPSISNIHGIAFAAKCPLKNLTSQKLSSNSSRAPTIFIPRRQREVRFFRGSERGSLRRPFGRFPDYLWSLPGVGVRSAFFLLSPLAGCTEGRRIFAWSRGPPTPFDSLCPARHPQGCFSDQWRGATIGRTYVLYIRCKINIIALRTTWLGTRGVAHAHVRTHILTGKHQSCWSLDIPVDDWL